MKPEIKGKKAFVKPEVKKHKAIAVSVSVADLPGGGAGGQ
jgi:hypothetical protein